MTNTFADKLIGMQLMSWDEAENTLIVKKGEEYFKLVFDDSDEGDCCGYNSLFVELFVSESELSRNPVIVKCEAKREDCDNSDHMKLTFFGEAKKIMTIDSDSGSGSGWCYGACVTVECVGLGINEVITSW